MVGHNSLSPLVALSYHSHSLLSYQVWLIVARAVQGIGGGGIMQLVRTLDSQTDKRGF
jgi:MFS family permease